jgi:hypothetical protein
MICCHLPIPQFAAFEYHSGLDMMTKEVKLPRKNKIFNSKFKQIEATKPCFFNTSLFDAKSDEIVSSLSVVQV